MTCDKGFESTVSQLYNSMCLSPLIQLDTHQINKWKPQSCSGFFTAFLNIIHFTDMHTMLQLHFYCALSNRNTSTKGYTYQSTHTRKVQE